MSTLMIPAVWFDFRGRSLVSTTALLLSGCGSLAGLGSDRFGCAGVPEGVHCLSARQVYQATEATDTVKSPPTEGTAPPAPTAPASDSARGGDGPLPVLSVPSASLPVISVAATGPHPLGIAPTPTPRLDGPVPIRTPAQVMRIWFGPWEDQGGNLHLTGYVYTEIEPRRWVVGTVAAAPPPPLTALQLSLREPQNPPPPTRPTGAVPVTGNAAAPRPFFDLSTHRP